MDQLKLLDTFLLQLGDSTLCVHSVDKKQMEEEFLFGKQHNTKHIKYPGQTVLHAALMALKPWLI